MDYQWYPGHMTKAVRKMREDINLVDLVIEILDARMPLSSRNPDIDRLAENKSRLFVLNKADLADENKTREFVLKFKEQGIYAITTDSKNRKGMDAVNDAVSKVCREKTERDLRRGIKNRPVRALVAGIPNVGKSAFINAYTGRAAAKTGNRPGVTKGKQWIRMSKNLELLDTPGILWPKFDDRAVGIKLAAAGSIRDTILSMTDLSMELIYILKEHYPDSIANRYGIDRDSPVNDDAPGILYAIADSRGCRMSGGSPDIDRAAGILIDDFRAGRLGRITLDEPAVFN